MVREKPRFTRETAVGGCESRICETAVAGYVRAMVAPVRMGPRCNGGYGGLDVLHMSFARVIIGKVGLGCRWWRRVIGEYNCRLR